MLKGGGQKDGRDPVFSGGAGQPGEEVQETGEHLKWKWKWKSLERKYKKQVRI